MHDRAATAAHQRNEAFREEIGRAIVDHAAHEGLGIGKRFVDDQLFRHFLYRGYDLVEHGIDDDQPTCGRAALASRGEGRLDDRGRSIFDLRRVEHDDGIVAAHLQRDDLARVRSQLAVDGDARTSRTREQNAIHHPVFDEPLTNFDAAVNALDHIFRHLGFVEAAGKEFAHGGRLFTRFENHDIAGNQRGNDVSVRQMSREIVGPQNRHHAMRLVA